MATSELQTAPRHPIPADAYHDPRDAARWLDAEAWLPLTIGEAVERVARDRAAASAVVDDSGRLSYGELAARTLAMAHELRARGLRPGDRVLVQLGIGRTAVVTLLALFRAGLIPVCAVARYRDYEMGALAALSGARGYIVEAGAAGAFDLVALARRVQEQHPRVEHLIVVDAEAAETESAADLDGPSPFDVAAFQLSGGTTGVPKIIPRYHAEYLGYAAAWARRTQMGPADVLLWSLPITHNAGMLMIMLPALLLGATMVLQQRFEVEAFLGAIERERVTLTGSIGPIAPRLLDDPDPGRFDLSSLRLFVTLNRAADIERHLGVRAVNLYGITEGILAAAGPDAPVAVRHMTVGEAASEHDEVRILEVGGDAVLPDGEVGELCFRGPSTLRAYYGNPDATRAAFAPDGFFRTGDLVRVQRIDGVRCLSFEGRAKDNIDRGGEKFGVEEIELLLARHPAVQEARVVGMPDRYLGERVCAFVTPRPGRSVPTIEEVSDHLLAYGLAKFKLPERIEALAEMPVTAVGKLDRAALRRRIAEIVTAEDAS
jgi:pyochelin biosynthesis protein PchD